MEIYGCTCTVACVHRMAENGLSASIAVGRPVCASHVQDVVCVRSHNVALRVFTVSEKDN